MRYQLLKWVCPSWDNTARRRGENGRVCLNALMVLFEKFYQMGVEESVGNGLHDDGMVLINARNDWARVVHLEPDGKNGYVWQRFVQNA